MPRIRPPRWPAAAALTLCLPLFIAACGGLEEPPPEPARRFSVIVLLVDTLRADHLGSYGYERDTSPNLDELARQGLLFTQHYSQAGCTFPSVNSLLTSRHPARFLGQAERFLGIPPEIPGAAEILKEAGYRTLAVSASPIVRATPSRFNPQAGFDRGFDRFDEHCLWRSADCVNARGLELLDEAGYGAVPESGEPSAEKEEPAPFFLYLHYMDPHGPYRPPAEHPRRFAEPYEGQDFIAEGNPSPIEKMLYSKGPKVEVSPRDVRHLVDLYDEEIAYFDSQLPELLGGLEERGLLADTLLVVLSDHGEEFLEHEGQIKHCRSVYDHLIKTPLILKPPAGWQLPPRRIEGLSQNLDLLPTLLDYLAVSATPAIRESLEGRSLREAIEAGRSAAPFAFSAQRFSRALVEPRLKLIYNFRTKTFELYDLAADPGETVDLLRRQPEDFRRLRAELFQLIRDKEGGLDNQRNLKAAQEAERQLKALGYLQ